MKPSPTMEPTSGSSPGLDPQFSMMESEPRDHKKGRGCTHQKPTRTQPYRPLIPKDGLSSKGWAVPGLIPKELLCIHQGLQNPAVIAPPFSHPL